MAKRSEQTQQEPKDKGHCRAASSNCSPKTTKQQSQAAVATHSPAQIDEEISCEQNENANQLRHQESVLLQNELRKLGVDLPSWILDKITASYTGMMPMERFLAETGQVSHESSEVQADVAVSDCGAVVDASEGAGCSETGDELEQADGA